MTCKANPIAVPAMEEGGLIRDYILANLTSRDDRLRIDALARKFLKSPSSLKKIFKANFDLPVHEFIVRKRMQLAQQFLRQKELSISDIASITGYQELSNFSRDFKTYFGYSPREFKKKAPFLSYFSGSTTHLTVISGRKASSSPWRKDHFDKF